MNEYLLLILSGLLFVLTHIVLAAPKLRGILVGYTNEKIYLGSYSLLSLILISWFVSSYNAITAQTFLWPPNLGTHIVPVILMPVALFLMVGGLMTPNLSQVGGERFQEKKDLVQGVFRITRHPVQWGICLWALSHVIAAGDSAGLLFFGILAFLSGFGSFVIDLKKQKTLGESWQKFAGETSNIPFAAILSGRQKLTWSEFKLSWFFIALAVYLLLWWGHSYLAVGHLLINPFA